MSEFISRASQAQQKLAEAGYVVDLTDFKVGRIFLGDHKDSGYVCFIAEVCVDGVPMYAYVKAFEGETERKAFFVPMEEAKVVDYTECRFRACGTTVWGYRKIKDDYIIVNERVYLNDEHAYD